MSDNNQKWMILGGVALAGTVVVVLEMIRRRRMAPLAQANKLIARCNDKIGEIEQSVASIRTMVQAAA